MSRLGSYFSRFIFHTTSFIKEMTQYAGYAVYSARISLKSDVADTRLGWLWWFLEPLGMMAFYFCVFQFLLTRKQLYVAAYVYVGIISFSLFRRALTTSLTLIKHNRKIISCLYVPKCILTLSVVIKQALKILLNVPIVMLLMWYYHIPLTIHIVEVVPVFLLYFLFVYAICCFFTHLGVYLPGIKKLTRPAMRVLMYLSNVIFAFQTHVKNPGMVKLVEMNPLAFFNDAIRGCILYGVGVDWATYLQWALVVVLLLAAGLILLRINENTYLKVV